MSAATMERCAPETATTCASPLTWNCRYADSGKSALHPQAIAAARPISPCNGSVSACTARSRNDRSEAPGPRSSTRSQVLNLTFATMPRCQPPRCAIFRKLRYRAVADKPLAIHRQVRVARKSDFRRKRSVRPLRLHSSCAGNAEFALHTIRQRGDAQQALRPDNHLLSMMKSRPLREA